MEQKFREGGPGQEGLPEIDLNDEYHKAFSMSLFGGNDTHTDVVSKPYQMLVLWEESMAETVARFLKDERTAIANWWCWPEGSMCNTVTAFPSGLSGACRMPIRSSFRPSLKFPRN